MVDLDLATQADVEDAKGSITTVGRNLNAITQELARTQLEVGLAQLEYPTGVFDVFVDNSKIESSTGVSVSVGPNGSVELTRLSTGDISVTVATGGSGFTEPGIAVGESNVYATEGSNVTVADKSDLSEVDNFNFSSRDINGLAIDGQYLYAVDGGGGDAGIVYKVDKSTGTVAGQFTGHDDPANAVVVSGGVGYSGDDGGVLYTWDPDTLSQQGSFEPHNQEIMDIDIGPQFGYSTGFDQKVKKWSKPQLSVEGSFSGHNDLVYGVVYGGGDIYSVGSDQAVRKLNPDTMNQVDVFTGFSERVEAVDYENAFVFAGAPSGNTRKIDPSDMTEVSAQSSGAFALDIDGGFGYLVEGGVTKFGENIPGSTQGSITTPFVDVGIVPERLVISRGGNVPPSASLSWQVEDDAGNTETYSDGDVDTETLTPSISSSTLRVKVTFSRDTSDDPVPVLTNYALYLSQ